GCTHGCGGGRRRRRTPRPPARTTAGEWRGWVAWAGDGPAHRRGSRSPVAVLLDGWLLQDPDRQQHLRHPGRGRSPWGNERLPGQGERGEAALLRREDCGLAHRDADL